MSAYDFFSEYCTNCGTRLIGPKVQEAVVTCRACGHRVIVVLARLYGSNETPHFMFMPLEQMPHRIVSES